MQLKESQQKALSKIRAILFDLHHTITKTRINMLNMTREAATEVGIQIEHVPDQVLAAAINQTDEWIREYQIENGVDIHWGGKPEDWLEINRKLMDYLEISDIADETLLAFEVSWKRIMAQTWESLVEEAKQTLEILKERGYILGICTRRHDDPEKLLKKWSIRHLFSTVHWTGVPGYAKPSPFTLLKAAEEIKINPRLCAYVGNYVDADVGAARSAEMIPILTIWANPEEKELTDNDTIVINRLDELLGLFTGISN